MSLYDIKKEFYLLLVKEFYLYLVKADAQHALKERPAAQTGKEKF